MIASVKVSPVTVARASGQARVAPKTRVAQLDKGVIASAAPDAEGGFSTTEVRKPRARATPRATPPPPPYNAPATICFRLSRINFECFILMCANLRHQG